MGKFVIKKAKNGFKFDLKAGNGQIILSSQIYTAESSCKKGIESIRNACDSPIEDQTVDGYAELKHPKYEVYLDKADEYRFRLKARNGEIVAASEGYTTKANCLGGIESIRKNAPDAQIVSEE